MLLGVMLIQAAKSDVSASDPYWPYVDFLLTGSGANNSTPSTDATGKTLAWGGDARIVTSGSSPFYGSWVAFDGAGDYVAATIPALGTGAFTIRGWLNTSTTPSSVAARIVRIGDNNASGNFQIVINTASKLRVDFEATIAAVSTSSVTNGVNRHIEIGRSAGGIVYIFVDGTLEASVSNSTLVSLTSLQVGGDTTVSNSYFSGALVDLEIYRGVCLHTATFTPPTAAPTS